MREIKFRAFNKNTGVMLQNVAVCHGNAMTWRIAPKDSPVITLEGKDGNTQFYCDWDFLKEDPYLIVEQYTGLKDCNGVEIYEGDLLYHHKQGVREVIYPMSESFAGFGLRSAKGMMNTLQDAAKLYEVIGNIHQNPELLERTNA